MGESFRLNLKWKDKSHDGKGRVRISISAYPNDFSEDRSYLLRVEALENGTHSFLVTFLDAELFSGVAATLEDAKLAAELKLIESFTQLALE